MNTEAKVVIGIVLATAVILGGGVWLANRGGSTGALGSAVSDMALLLPQDRPTAGPAEAKVTIVEFADFQCPACGAAYPVLQSVREAYPEDVRLVFRHFPLIEAHAHAQAAAEAAEAARAQGKFWEMYDRLFTEQERWSKLSDQEVQTTFEQYAQALSLDMERFKKELAEHMHAARPKEDRADGTALGVRGTPTLFINGHLYNGQVAFAALKAVIDAELSN